MVCLALHEEKRKNMTGNNSEFNFITMATSTEGNGNVFFKLLLFTSFVFLVCDDDRLQFKISPTHSLTYVAFSLHFDLFKG